MEGVLVAFDTVGLGPSLIPWQRAGVEFLLSQDAVPDVYSLCSTSRPPAVSVPAAAPRPAMARPPVAATPPAGARPASASTAQVAPATRSAAPSAARKREAADMTPDSFDSSGASSALLPPLLPVEQWPAAWQQRLSKTAPATVLWTYWSLGLDLSGHPNPERRALLQRLLADLGHPAGTHSFWPTALPDPALVQEGPETLLHANPQVFWSGVHALKARALVVMGSPAAKALELPPRLRPFQQTRHHGRLVVVLRDVDFLVQEVQRYDAVREFLRQALQPFVGRS